MSKELRIGLLVTISVLVFFAGFYYLKGSNLFSSNNTYYGYYENVQGLQASAPITIKGLQVGRVKGLTLNGNRVAVEFEVGSKYALPKGTVAQLYAADLLGTKAVKLDLGTSPEVVADNSVLPTNAESGMLDALSAEVNPLLKNAQLVALHLDSVLVSVNSVFNETTRQRLMSSVASLDATMKNFASISSALQGKNGALARTIDNAESFSNTLASNRENLNATMANMRTLSNQLKDAPIEQTARELQGTSAKLNSLMQKIEQGEGSLGMLANDKALYNNLNSTATEFSKLAADLKAHPSRYVNITIFGRRAKVGNE
jgi:phospholipid/cholesterol/gamma-HCH transport system substrate-binding protein